jgi:hypothetical protein
MSRKPAKLEHPWTNRFQTPTGEALAEALTEADRDLVVAARSRLDQVEDTLCEIRWLGVPWRWSLVYMLKADRDDALAYLVPEPTRPQICIPLDHSALERVTPRRLSRGVRDGIVFAAEIGGRRWASWPIQSEAQVDELILLVKAKVESRTATA